MVEYRVHTPADKRSSRFPATKIAQVCDCSNHGCVAELRITFEHGCSFSITWI